MKRIVSFLEERRDAYLADLRALVGIDSNSYDQEGVNRVNDWLENRLNGLGCEVERFPYEGFGDDLLAVLCGTGAKHILLLGHSDTVFPRGTAAKRPMSIQGDRILGPGTCDMKGGLLAGVYALEALRVMEFNSFGRITFLCVSDEEIEVAHSDGLIRTMSRQADAALTLEAARANGDIVTARKGLRWYSIEAFGRAAHAGVEPEKGRNAILALAHHVVALHKLNDLRPGATVNAGVIEGGSAPNVVPEYARVRVDLRAFSEEDLRVLIDAVEGQVHQEIVPDVRVTMMQEGPGDPAMPYTSKAAALEKLAKKTARELGFEVKGARTGGASDANLVAAEGTPVLDGLGPIGGLDHSPKEYIELSSVVPRTALLAGLIMAITEKNAL